jgi:hypothetical protein
VTDLPDAADALANGPATRLVSPECRELAMSDVDLVVVYRACIIGADRRDVPRRAFTCHREAGRQCWSRWSACATSPRRTGPKCVGYSHSLPGLLAQQLLAERSDGCTSEPGTDTVDVSVGANGRRQEAIGRE